VEVEHSHPTSITDVGTSEHPDTIILGNNDTSQRVREISINYIESRESYVRKSIVVDLYFPESIPWQSAKKRLEWNQWKDAIQAALASLSKRKVFSQPIPTPCGIFLVGFKWIFVRK